MIAKGAVSVAASRISALALPDDGGSTDGSASRLCSLLADAAPVAEGASVDVGASLGVELVSVWLASTLPDSAAPAETPVLPVVAFSETPVPEEPTSAPASALDPSLALEPVSDS